MFFRFTALMVINLLVWPQAYAAPSLHSARKQVYVDAVRLASADITAQAKRQKWTDYSAKFTVFIPNEIAQYKACKTALLASIPIIESNNLLRMRYDIRCEDGQGWEIAVTVKPDIAVAIVVSSKNLPRGTRLSVSDVEMKKRSIANLHGSFFTDFNDVVGMTLKRHLPVQQVLSPSVLEQPTLVQRGQTVTLMAEQQGISAHTLGEALQKGRKGELIKVKNVGSQKVVLARVMDVGVVAVMALALE